MLLRSNFLFICLIGFVECQLTNILFRPAINFFNTLTGTGSNQDQTSERSSFQNFFTTTQKAQFQQSNNIPYQQSNNANYQQQNYNRNPSGSCNDIFSYQQDYSSGTYGKLTITNPNNGQNILEINLSLASRLQSKYLGEILLVKDDQSSARDVQSGLPLLYRIKFPTQNPLPKPISVYLNSQLICSNQNDDGVTSISLKHFFNIESQNGIPPRVQYTQPPPVYTQPRPVYTQPPPVYTQPPPVYTQPPPVYTQQQYVPPASTQRSIDNIQNQNDNYVCGSPVGVYSQSLVIGGKRAARGEWPWLVAMYKSESGNLDFFCGGSLISNNFVLTAAHCLLNKQEKNPLRLEYLLLFMGKYSLLQWNEEGLEKRSAKRFMIHPEWNQYRNDYNGDIALVQTDSPVQYSKSIRPICLWNVGPDLSRVVGQTGIVAGWGVNEYGEKSHDFPKKVKAPIVTNEKCLRSSPGFAELTSDNTFCAGGLRGEGPCSGDSGGGLVLQQGNQWFIRGIVSASLVVNDVCDVNKYAVFTDVAKYMSWIRNII